MRPALSVIFLTTLAGAAQGLVVMLFGVELAARVEGFSAAWQAPRAFFAGGAALAVLLGALGLAASFFHLGHPERAWRAVAMWRTSWLSRECLCLPLFLAATGAYGLAHALGWHEAWLVGAAATICAAALFVCTAMIYACLRVLQEWASPLTLANFVLLGCASGAMLAALFAVRFASGLVPALSIVAVVLTLAGGVCRMMMLRRNARLVHRSTLATATGIASDRIVQTSRGFTAQAFNTREFFHGRSARELLSIKWALLGGAFAVPIVLALWARLRPEAAAATLGLACALQYAGLVAERWTFFAEARHPQNLYYGRG